MKLVLSHTTALDMLRSYRCGAPFQLMRTQATSLVDSAHTHETVARFEIPVFPRADERLHVLVPEASMLCDSIVHVSHLFTSELPSGSLLQVNKDVYCASAALVFVQLGAQIPLLQLVQIGAELCGSYSLQPAGIAGMKRCRPMATVQGLLHFAEKLPCARGVKTATEALRWVPEMSASPLETALYLLLVLPTRRGGYGLPKPVLNPRTALGTANARSMQVDELHCDLHWPEAHVAIEYNSKDSHVGQLTHDARRTNALTSEGEQVFTMTPAILANPALCDDFVRQVARAIKWRLRGNALAPSPKRASLRADLFPWV